MPEDQNTSVSEDQAETIAPVDTPAPDTEYDEEKAFGSETAEDKAEAAGVEVGLETEEETETESEPEEETVDVEEDEETDEDILRGQELLDADKGAEETKPTEETKEAAPAAAPTEAAEYSPSQHSNTAEDIQFFSTVLPENFLPKDPVVLEDGTELDFDYFQKENPEFLPAVAAVTKNIVDQMIANNAIAGGNVYDHINHQLFFRTVAKDVPEHHKIYDSADFQKWLPNQPETIRALMQSDRPADAVRVFRRFLNKEGLDAAKDKVVDIDRKRAAKKKKFDSVHKTTVKSKKVAMKSAVDNEALEDEGFTSTDDDDDF